MNLESLTNARPVRQRGKILTAMPPAPSAGRNAAGSFKMTEELADVLGLATGNYVDVQKDKDSGTFYITKGVAGNEAEGIKQNGNKLGKSGSVYKFAAAKVWVNLGKDKAQVEYTIGEGVDVGGQMYYPLIEGETIEVETKETSASSTSSDASANTEAPAENLEVAVPADSPSDSFEEL